MIIFIQHTICDLRILSESENLLYKPNWKNVIPYKDFVSGSGQIIQRTKRGIENWIGENFLCKIRKGICEFPKIKINNKYVIKCVGKHQYNDGNFLTKYEFVFHLKKIKWEVTEDKLSNYYSFQELTAITKYILSSEIKVRKKDYRYTEYKFGNFDKGLKEFHLTTTTKNERMEHSDLSKIQIGMSQIFFQLSHIEHFNDYPQKVVKADTYNFVPLQIYSWMEPYNQKPYRFWLLKEENQDALKKNKNSREIRIGCLRIHSEVECLKILISNLPNELLPNTEKSNLIQEYFNKSVTRILKSKKNIEKTGSHETLTFQIRELFSTFEPGTLSNLIENIKEKKFRKNIENKVVSLIVNNAGQMIIGNGTINNGIKDLNMDAFNLTKQIISFILPVLKTKAVKKVAEEFSEAANTEALIIWERIKPIFIKEEFVNVLEEDPANEEAKLELEYNLTKELKKNPELHNELNNLLSSSKSKENKTTYNQTIIGQGNIYGGDQIGGDKIGGDKIVGK